VSCPPGLRRGSPGSRSIRVVRWFVPLAEVAVGLLLLVGLFARLAAGRGASIYGVGNAEHFGSWPASTYVARVARRAQTKRIAKRRAMIRFGLVCATESGWV